MICEGHKQRIPINRGALQVHEIEVGLTITIFVEPHLTQDSQEARLPCNIEQALAPYLRHSRPIIQHCIEC
jgi:hypothetical protein